MRNQELIVVMREEVQEDQGVHEFLMIVQVVMKESLDVEVVVDLVNHMFEHYPIKQGDDANKIKSSVTLQGLYRRRRKE